MSYLFVTINIKGLQSNLQALQAISIAEGINERIKARLNTKTKIQISPEQEEKIKSEEEDIFEDEEELAEDEESFEDDFDEETEDFDEYYADEILKISRYITFRDPPEPPETSEEGEEPSQAESINQKPEANVEMIGSINIPGGTVLNKGTMIVVYKDEKINLNLPDISPEQPKQFKAKLPIPLIKSLSPNYSEGNKRSSFIVVGENLNHTENLRFGNKEIVIEDVRGGPRVEFLIQKDVMPGLVRFYWEGAQSEFYVTPTFDGSSRPVITDVKTQDNNQLLEVMAGQRGIALMVYGLDLYLKKSLPVVIPDVCGIVPKVKDTSQNGNELTVTVDIDRKVDPGIHSLVVATEGGISNGWVFNILPPPEEEITANVATFSSSLTLLDIRVVDDLLPVIDESEDFEETEKTKKQNEETEEEDLPEESEEEEVKESQKLGPFANTDLETLWLLETSAMVGKITRTVSETVTRQTPNINFGVTTNGHVYLEGGGFKIIGAATAKAALAEPTYISNTVLKVSSGQGGRETEKQRSKETKEEPEGEEEIPEQTISDLGFQVGGLVAVYKDGERIDELDYATIGKIEGDTIELSPPGLMDFHYEGDLISQFIPPLISREKVTESEAEKHLAPSNFAISIPNYAKFPNIFRSNTEQFAELADLYTNETTVPQDDFGLPLGFMGLSYLESTPAFSDNNSLTGKGILIIDTRSDNLGKPAGEVEISGDSRNPAEFNGIVYVHGNLRIDGNVTINGALIVDNESSGQLQISNNATGRIAFNQNIIKQCLLYTPFSTKPGTVKISNKPIDLSGYVESGKQTQQLLGAAPLLPQEEIKTQAEVKAPEEALVETAPVFEPIPQAPGRKSAEDELIELF